MKFSKPGWFEYVNTLLFGLGTFKTMFVLTPFAMSLFLLPNVILTVVLIGTAFGIGQMINWISLRKPVIATVAMYIFTTVVIWNMV